ncbi:hypothetical protein [Brevibacillus migulae]|uniref:hypothetical protein n=1 Tax=Brevibacillus migulae TaxID=1644114 RepID=UPI00106DDF90|nr:hypothetical protein [Brevibacillus migulae]
MKQINLLMLAALLLLAVASGFGIEIPEWIQKEKAQAQGQEMLKQTAAIHEEKLAFVMRDLQSTSTYMVNEEEAKKSFSPLSTVHIPLAFLTQDSQKKEALQQSLQKLGYGHQASDGTTAITVREQVEFLVRMLSGQLSVDQDKIDAVKEGMLIHKQDGLVYAGMASEKEENAWYVGYVETKEKTFVFATHLTSGQDRNGERARKKTETILRGMNILPAEAMNDNDNDKQL